MMKHFNPISNLFRTVLPIVGWALLLSGCHINDPERSNNLQLIGGMGVYYETSSAGAPARVADAAAATAASANGYTSVADPAPIRVLLYDVEAEEVRSGQTDAQLKAYLKLENHKQYYVHGFMPSSACSGELGNVSADGATLTLSGVQALGQTDICVISGVKKTTEESPAPILSTTESTFQPGKFAYEGSERDNKAYILMDHICACLDFRFAVADNYSELRTIRLKSMQIRPEGGLSAGTVTVTLPITASSVSYAATSTQAADNDHLLDAYTGPEATADQPAGLLLPTLTDATAEGGDYYHHVKLYTIGGLTDPEVSTTLTLRLITCYDVYDKVGNLIRENCKAENKLPIDKTQRALAPGTCYPVKLTITPTYLYVLSDPDLDNPSVEVE